jgi:transposase
MEDGMATVYQTDNRSGITYAYESVSRWDKERKQSRSTRTLIGRVDAETGAIVPTDGRMKGEKVPKTPAKALKPPKYVRLFYGATYLFDAIGEKLGVAEDLRLCFPDIHKEILSLAYYLILEDKNPLYRFEKWGQTHKHPYGENIPSQRSSEIFSAISEDSMHQFFRLQGRRRTENEYWAYDITTISSYSECLRQIQYGHNKDGDGLPQLKLALVYGEQSKLPFYYRKLAGNIPDSMTVRALLSELDIFGFKKVKLVMDRGFYKEENINGLLKDHLKFLVAVKMSLVYVRAELDKVYDELLTFEYYNEDYELYSMTLPYEWSYSQVRLYKGDVLKEIRRVYIHFYYSIDRAAEDQKDFDRRLMALRNEIVSGKRVPEHEKLYKKYFNVKSTPVRGNRAVVKEEAVKKDKRYFGFFALLSNEKMDSITALALYRNKDLVEKAFGNIKERLNFRRTLVSTEQSLNGKLFVEFVALIYLSYLNKQMQDARLYKFHTLAGLLDKLDVIECFEHPGRKLQVGEILDKQRDLYVALDVKSPTSL